MSDIPAFEIEPEELAAQLKSGAVRPRLIDCREPDEFAICKLEGSELLPLSQFVDQVDKLGPDKEVPLVVYCHHGMRSARATEYLRALGYQNTRSLAGGIDRWAVEIEPGMDRY